MKFSKSIVLLCLFDELEKTSKLIPMDIINKYNINRRQMWRYIKEIKNFYKLFHNKSLIYDISTKTYYVKINK